MAIEEARQAFSADLKDEICPCCGRLCRERKGRFSYWMGVGLLAMYQHHKQNPGRQFCHIENLWIDLGFKSQRMRDVSRLKYYRLIQHAPLNPDSVVRGFWRVTDDGEQFIKGVHSVPERCTTFNDHVTAWGKKLVTIGDVLRSAPFNLDDLIAIKGSAFFEQFFPQTYEWDERDNEDFK
jgi:hypothetical protein